MNAPATLEQALACARRGWPVFPCQPGSKVPATRHGFRDATTDPGQIQRWWQRNPHANLAIATGTPGPDVLDVDQHGPDGSGYPAYHQLHDAGLLTHAHALVATPSGGVHAYFTGTTQPSGRLRRHHLDFKAAGGYVLAPPSVVNGTPYQLLRHQPESGHLDWATVTSLLEPQHHAATRPATVSGAGLSRLAAWVADLAPEGHNRNDGLFWAACRAAETDNEAVLAELAIAARATGLTDREINATITSARRTARRRPPEHHAGREGTS